MQYFVSLWNRHISLLNHPGRIPGGPITGLLRVKRYMKVLLKFSEQEASNIVSEKCLSQKYSLFCYIKLKSVFNQAVIQILEQIQICFPEEKSVFATDCAAWEGGLLTFTMDCQACCPLVQCARGMASTSALSQSALCLFFPSQPHTFCIFPILQRPSQASPPLSRFLGLNCSFSPAQ